MNSFGIGVLWCIAQVTLLTAVAGALYHVVRRLGPATGAFVSLVSLLLITAVTFVSFIPWPNWLPALEARWSAPTVADANSNRPTDSAAGDTAASAVVPLDPQSTGNPSPTAAALRTFWQEIRNPHTPSDSSNSLRWTGMIALVVVTGVILGSIRLGFGFLAILRYRRESQAIRDSRVLELVDVLAAELSCTRKIEVRESARLVGAATLGWRHPLILLPAGWRQWHEEDLRAVLAHELAHIHHADYFTWLIAQIGLVLHFYHPLAHWLCRCLRLDQELVADSVAARLVGGRQPYLQSLAKIALQQSDVPLSWPVRTFLPTRRTFLRRIEMLRDSKDKWLSQSPASVRWLAAVVLLTTGLAVSGLREPGLTGAKLAEAQQPPPAKGAPAAARAGDRVPFGLSYVPRDAVWVVALRPAALMQRPALQPLATMMLKDGNLEKSLGCNPADVEMLQILQLAPHIEPGAESVAAIVRFTNPASAQALAKHLAPHATKDVYGTQEYFRQEPQSFYFFGDDRTLVHTRNIGVLRRCIVAGTTGASLAKWAREWQPLAASDATLLINTAALRPMMAQTIAPASSPAHLPFAAYAPLWEKTEVAVANLDVTDSVTLNASTNSLNEEDAKRVRDTLAAGVTMARNALSQTRQSAAASRSADGPLLLGSIDVVDELLENLEITTADTHVKLKLHAGAGSAMRLFSIVLPAVSSARTSARRAQSMNNLKQIALAFHNFHDVNQRFPAAVTYGPNQVPRSWRVELLPYLEQTQLYDQYRKDEPWDSESNKKVLAQMPAVFRSPMDDPNSTNASCFAITGPGTVFDAPVGKILAQIPDGTSNTLLVVESKQNIPWTKPEDLPYSEDKPLPKFGGWEEGGFSGAICDGSVRFFSDKIDHKILRLLITPSDGHPIPEFNER